MTDTLPDIEGALRTWLRGRSAITTLLGGQRVFFGTRRMSAQPFLRPALSAARGTT